MRGAPQSVRREHRRGLDNRGKDAPPPQGALRRSWPQTKRGLDSRVRQRQTCGRVVSANEINEVVRFGNLQ